MSWVLWFWLWSCNRPGESLLDVLLNVSIYHPDIPISSHLYSFAAGVVRDAADILAGVQVLVKDNSVVVVDEVRYGSKDFGDLCNLERPVDFFPSSLSNWKSVSPSFLMRFAMAET